MERSIDTDTPDDDRDEPLLEEDILLIFCFNTQLETSKELV